MQRLSRLIQRVDREDHHLRAVRYSLLKDDCSVTVTRMRTLLGDDLGADRLESFGTKFGRLQDTMVDKLIPAVLQ